MSKNTHMKTRLCLWIHTISAVSVCIHDHLNRKKERHICKHRLFKLVIWLFQACYKQAFCSKKQGTLIYILLLASKKKLYSENKLSVSFKSNYSGYCSIIKTLSVICFQHYLYNLSFFNPLVFFLFSLSHCLQKPSFRVIKFTFSNFVKEPCS